MDHLETEDHQDHLDHLGQMDHQDHWVSLLHLPLLHHLHHLHHHVQLSVFPLVYQLVLLPAVHRRSIKRWSNNNHFCLRWILTLIAITSYYGTYVEFPSNRFFKKDYFCNTKLLVSVYEVIVAEMVFMIDVIFGD